MTEGREGGHIISTPAAIEVRALRAEDGFQDLFSLSRQFFAEYQAHHPSFFAIDRLTDDHIRAYFSQWLDNRNGKAFVAIAGGRIIGYITVYVYTQPDYWQVKRLGEISGLMVHQAYRRRGVATQLLAKAQAFLAENKVKHLTVYTAVANEGALGFYRCNGMLPLYTTMLGAVPDTSDRSMQP